MLPCDLARRALRGVLRAMILLLASIWAWSAGTLAPEHPVASGGPADWERIVNLPPMLVEDFAGQPWLIAELPNLQVLSRCSQNLTSTLIDRQQRLLNMLGQIYPAALQPGSDVPTVILLDDADKQGGTSRQLADILQSRFRTSQSPGRVQFMPNFTFWDVDTRVVYFLLKEYGDDPTAVSIAPAYLRYLLETRAPVLPRWFIDGMVQWQDTLVMTVPPVARVIDTAAVRITKTPRYPHDLITVQPLVWITETKTKEMHQAVKQTARARGIATIPDDFPFIPLERLLQPDSATGLPPAEAELYGFESALFLRWCFDPAPKDGAAGQPKPGADALFRYVAGAASHADDATWFAQCFGLTADQVETRLRGYLPYATLNNADYVIRPAERFVPAKPAVRIATRLEMARLKSRLERLETLYVRDLYPFLTADYEAQTRRTLDRVAKEDLADPQLLAEKALLEVDCGNDTAARPLLALAAAADLAHPRIYFELARIEFNALQAVAPNLQAFTAESDAIETLLIRGLARKPPLAGSFALLFELWLRRGQPLTAAEEAWLDAGANRFPRQFRIVYAAALLHSAQGNLAKASALVTRSLSLFTAERDHERFASLQTLLAQANVPDPS